MFQILNVSLLMKTHGTVNLTRNPKMNLQSKECLMVRNDVAEDMTARAVGINVFLLTDCLINKEHEDINQYPRGSYEQLLNYIENLK